MSITHVSFTLTQVCIQTDRSFLIGHPIVWHLRLLSATEKERSAWQIARFGDAVRWEAIDEDLSLEGFLNFSEETFDGGVAMRMRQSLST